MLQQNCSLSCKCCRRLQFSTFHLSVTSSIPILHRMGCSALQWYLALSPCLQHREHHKAMLDMLHLLQAFCLLEIQKEQAGLCKMGSARVGWRSRQTSKEQGGKRG